MRNWTLATALVLAACGPPTVEVCTTTIIGSERYQRHETVCMDVEVDE